VATSLRRPSGQNWISRLEVGDHDPLLATVSDWAGALGYELTLRKTDAGSEVERRLAEALHSAGRSALGMPATIDTFKAMLARAGLSLALAEAEQ
jgi:glycine cleavage system aminomethyltransferase T